MSSPSALLYLLYHSVPDIPFHQFKASPEMIRSTVRPLTAENLEPSLEKRLADSESFSLSRSSKLVLTLTYIYILPAIPSLHTSQSSEALEAASLDLRLDRISLVRSALLSNTLTVDQALTLPASFLAVGAERRTDRRRSSLNPPRSFSSLPSQLSRFRRSPHRLSSHRIRQRHPNSVRSRSSRRSQSHTHSNASQRSSNCSCRRKTSRRRA